jgi:hypothetical protein
MNWNELVSDTAHGLEPKIRLWGQTPAKHSLSPGVPACTSRTG